jgi:predicted RND superfamily exporter protein
MVRKYNNTKLLNKLGVQVSEHPKMIVIITFFITFIIIAGAFAAIETGHTEFRTNINDLFPKYEEVEILQEIENDFGTIEPYIVLIKADDVLTPEVFNQTILVVQELQKDEQVRKYLIGETTYEKETYIFSLPSTLASYYLIRQGNLDPTTSEIHFVASTFNSSQEIRNLIIDLINDPMVTDLEKSLITSFLPKTFDPRSNENVRSMVLMVQLDSSVPDKELEEAELYIRDEIINDLRTDEIKMYSYAFGLLSPAYTEAEAELEPLFALMVIAILIISWINYQRISDVLIANLTLLIVIIWTFCIIGIFGFDYNFLNIMVPLLVTGLAIDFSFHSIIGYRERLTGKDKPETRIKNAVIKMITLVGVAFILATITTTFGFVSNVVSDLPSIGEFGIIAACGIIFACILNLTFVPALRVSLDLRRVNRGKSLQGEISSKKISAKPGRILGLLSGTIKQPWVLIVVLIVLCIPGYAMITGIRASYDPTGELLETQEITKAYRTLNKDYTVGTEMIIIRIDGDLEDPGVWQAINRSINNACDDQYVATQNGTAQIEWIGTLLQSIGRFNVNYRTIDSNLDGIPDPGINSDDLQRTLDNISEIYPAIDQYIHKGPEGYDGVIIRVITRTNVGQYGLEAKNELINDFQPVYDTGARLQYTGEPIIWNKGLEDFTESLILSTFLVIIFAFFLLLLVFRIIYNSPLLGILTAIPPILAFGWTLGFMALIGIPLNMMTAFVGAFTIGLGIDYPIHLVTRWAEERKNGFSIIDCYTISIRSTGKELIFSAITTLSAFIAFALMPMPVMAQFGIVMIASILFCLLGAVFVMPMLIRIWHRSD